MKGQVEPMNSSTKILIVDDEPEVLLILEKRLSNAGYQITKADNGRSAVRRAREERPDLLSACRERFVHLLVDEFQDVNGLQYRLVQLLAGDGRNLFVIGDPDQAIYGFRGADRRYFFRLREDFPEARLIRLETNYRSVGRILRAARPCGGRRELGRPQNDQ